MEIEMNSDLGRDAGSDEDKDSSCGSSVGSAFCALEEDYARILKEMRSNEALAEFEAEYTRLYEALYDSQSQSADLSERCRELQDALNQSASKVICLQQEAAEDETTIQKLNEKIDRAMKMADAAHTREQNAQEIIENLRLSITKLSHEIEQKNKQLGMEEESAVSKQKEGLLKERERLVGEMETLRQRMANTTLYTEELERKTSAVDHQMTQMQESLDTQHNEISKERRNRERLEDELREIQEEMKTKNTDLQNANGMLKNATNNVRKLESVMKEQNNTNDKLQKDIDHLMAKRMHLQAELDIANTAMEEMSKDNKEKNKQVRYLTQNHNKLKDEMDKACSQMENSTKKLFTAQAEKSKAVEEMTRLQATSKSMALEMEMLKKQTEADRRKLETMTRDKDLMTKNMTINKVNMKKLEMMMNLQEQTRKKLEAEIDSMTETMGNLKKTLTSCERERDNFSMEAQELAQQVEEQLDEVKMKQTEIFDYKKRLAEADTKFRQQQNLFEAVRADRNACSKSLIEAQDEIQEVKGKLKIMSHQVEQLKEEIATKEVNLIKDEFMLGKTEKEKDALRVELQSARKDISELRHDMEEMKQEEKRLRHNLHQAEMDISRQKKEIDTIMNERDILGTQLVRRNDELSLQYSRAKILQGSIHKGEAQYGQRLDDIRLLKLEVKKLRTERALLSKSINNISDLRQEIFHLDRDLTREKLKVMALEEEVQNPLNIHRWRKLEGSDPDTYELLIKIQLLQKRVLKMCSEMIEKEKKIKEGEKLYMNLRQVLSKQPGPEVVIRLEKTQKALRARGKKMKCLVSELNMCESQVNEYKFDLERMTKEMCDLKEKYYAQKRKEQKAIEDKPKDLCKPILPPVPPCHKKFCGGGFNMAGPTPRNCFALESANSYK